MTYMFKTWSLLQIHTLYIHIYTFFVMFVCVYKATADAGNVAKMKSRKCSHQRHCFRSWLKMLLELIYFGVWYIKYKQYFTVYSVYTVHSHTVLSVTDNLKVTESKALCTHWKKYVGAHPRAQLWPVYISEYETNALCTKLQFTVGYHTGPSGLC